MKTYLFKLQKGGTGATSLGLSVAVQLAKSNHKTLFIDADPQGNATTWLNFDSINYELSDILSKKIEPQKAILKTNQENLFVIPTAGLSGELSQIKELVTNQEPFIIADILENLQKEFEFCLIDLSPSYGNFERSCYLASDEIIPVLLLDEFSEEGLTIFNNHLEQTRKAFRISDKMKSNKVILNKMNRQKTISKIYLEKFERNFSKENLFVIPQDPIFEKAQLMKYFIQDLSETKKETLSEIKRLTESL